MKTIISILFLLQLSVQISLKYGVIEYENTTPMYEDLVTTLLGCTLIIVFAMYELNDKK